MEDAARAVTEITGSNSGKEFVSHRDIFGTPVEDIVRIVPDMTRIKSAIGWEPKIDLNESLKKIIDKSR